MWKNVWTLNNALTWNKNTNNFCFHYQNQSILILIVNKNSAEFGHCHKFHEAPKVGKRWPTSPAHLGYKLNVCKYQIVCTGNRTSIQFCTLDSAVFPEPAREKVRSLVKSGALGCRPVRPAHGPALCFPIYPIEN